ncbi:protein kinase [bacterium]|nr:protein kinase [bacterium]
MTNRQIDEEAIFHFARDLTDTAKRSEYLQQVCGEDQELRERIQGLLDAHEKEQTFLKSNVAFKSTVTQAPAKVESGSIAKPGEEIGRFKLLQQIGEGGFGVVFMAEQHKPIRRKVALKVIKPGMDTKGVVARFEAERQALAMMDHPNIAKVLDGGTTDSGRPYFVMELVKGVPITDYCDQNQLSADQRLELFITVCKAIQHAHQKGIIHRDLKPSNILVALHDGTPVVKVIDFGVAKAVNQQLTDKTLYTAFGQMVGTPQYMSPEQAEISGLDIDTRSDVYSLGVILYELLTGSTPLETDRLRKAGYAEIQRLVKESEPQRPSTRLSTSGEKLTAIAKHRSVAPDRLSALIKGDLDWVVMKALEKDRNRRYSTPVELADDVNRYLTKEPVEAYPPSSVYKMKKFVRRNKGLVFAASAFAVIMITATTVSIWNWNAAVAAKAEAEEALDDFREELFERGITAVFSGDDVDYSIVCERWRKANFEPAMIKVLEGLKEFQNGDNEEAEEILENAYLNNKKNQAIAVSYYIVIQNSPIRLRKKMDRENELFGNKIEWDNDSSGGRYKRTNNLLNGWANILVNHREAEKQLESALEGRPWPIARVMYACALAQVALDDRDEDKAWKAVEEIRKVEPLLEDVPLVKNIGLWARYHYYWLSTDEVCKKMIKEETDELAKALKEKLKYKNNHQLVANWYKMTGNADLENIYKAKKGNWQGALRSAHYYEIGNDKEATVFLRNGFEDAHYAVIASACVAAVNGDHDQAMKAYKQIMRDSKTPRIKLHALDILLLLGKYEMAADGAKKLNKLDEQIWHLRDKFKVELRLDIIQDAKLPVKQLAAKYSNEINKSGSAEIFGNYTLGLIALAKDDAPSAKAYFEKVIQSKQFPKPQYAMAKAFLARGICSTADEK